MLSCTEKKFLSDRLVNVVIDSLNYSELPGDIAKDLLTLEMQGMLSSTQGIQKLAEAGMLIAPEKTSDIINEVSTQQEKTKIKIDIIR